MDYNYFSKEILDYLIAKFKGYFDYLAEHCGGGASEAKNVSYDDTLTQLGLTNVQDVIADLIRRITNLEESYPKNGDEMLF